MRRMLTEIIIVSVLLFILALAYRSMRASMTEEENYKVSVVIPGSQNERWDAFKNGMDQAASEYNITINYATTGEYISSNDLWAKAVSEADAGAEAVVIAPIASPGEVPTVLNDGTEAPTKLEALKDTELVLFGTDIEPAGVYPVVAADDAEMGRCLAEALLNDYGNSLKAFRIGIMSGTSDNISETVRKEAFMEILEQNGVKITWSMGLGDSLEDALTQKLQSEENETEIIVAFGNVETEIAGDVVSNINPDIKVYGTGYSEKAVHYLDEGPIRCLVLYNDYYMGYNCIKEAAYLLNGKKKAVVATEESGTELYTVYNDEVFEEENLGILFPVTE